MAKIAVAPLVGAWIEICLACMDINCVILSLPSWERGLKSHREDTPTPSQLVAPLVGAWIEIIWLENGSRAERRRSPRGSVD